MGRRRRGDSDTSVFGEIVTALFTMPFWVGVTCSLFLFALMRWPLPWYVASLKAQEAANQGKNVVPMSGMLQPLSDIVHGLSVPALGGFLLIVIAGRIYAWMYKPAEPPSRNEESTQRNRSNTSQGSPSSVNQLLNRDVSLRDVGQLTWEEFELLLKQIFLKIGYEVTHTGSDTSDGGIDLILTKGNQRTIVQCKHWQTRQVPVSVVREQLGLKLNHRAHHCMIVTSGKFTPDGIAFASQNGIILIDGEALSSLISNPTDSTLATVIAKADAKTPPTIDRTSAFPKCPDCGARMAKKIAGKGKFEGQPFWACTQYPRCRGKINIG